jgi:hypothetical protein
MMKEKEWKAKYIANLMAWGVPLEIATECANEEENIQERSPITASNEQFGWFPEDGE